jgi:hypothetical protein
VKEQEGRHGAEVLDRAFICTYTLLQACSHCSKHASYLILLIMFQACLIPHFAHYVPSMLIPHIAHIAHIVASMPHTSFRSLCYKHASYRILLILLQAYSHLVPTLSSLSFFVPAAALVASGFVFDEGGAAEGDCVCPSSMCLSFSMAGQGAWDWSLEVTLCGGNRKDTDKAYCKYLKHMITH